MNKRDFLAAAALAPAALPAMAQGVAGPRRSPVLLTVTGAIRRTNRGPLDAMLDGRPMPLGGLGPLRLDGQLWLEARR